MRPGDELHLDREASPQFVSPLRLRLIRVMAHVTYDGWMWIEGYQLDVKGDAVGRRELYVRKDGVRKV